MSETTDRLIDKMMDFDWGYVHPIEPVGTVTHRMINRQRVTGIAIQDQIRLQQHLDHERNQLLPKTPGTVGPKNADRAFQYGLRPGQWRQADHTVIEMSRMSDEHLHSALKMAQAIGHNLKCVEMLYEIEWRQSLPSWDR